MNEKGPFFAQVSTIVERGEEFLRLLAGMGFSPNQKKVLERVFSGKDAEKMVGKTSKTIAKLYSNNAPNQAYLKKTSKFRINIVVTLQQLFIIYNTLIGCPSIKAWRSSAI